MQSNGHIRIAYLVSQYPAINHIYILHEVKRLRALGFEVHVASIRSPDRSPEHLTADEQEELALTYFVKPLGVWGAIGPHLTAFFSRPVCYLGGLIYALRLGRRNPGRTLPCLFYFAEAVGVGRWMERRHLSHVHIHYSSTVGLIVKSIFPITMSIAIHGSGEFDDPVAFHLREKINASSFVCAISNYARSQLMKASDYCEWAKLELSPLGIDPAVFAPRPFRETPASFEVICVGQLAPAKGHHILIAALDRLIKQGRKLRLRLIGDGPIRAGLEQDVSERGLIESVVFEGPLNHTRVQTCYREADIFALASFSEGVPVVLMEAMSMEIPCVATFIAGIPELIRDGIDGLLVAPSDDEGLAQAIAKLMDDPMLRRRLGRAGRQRILEKYDAGRNTAHLASIFRRRIGEIAKAVVS